MKDIIGQQINAFTFCCKTEDMKFYSIDKYTVSLNQILFATKNCEKIGLFKSDYLMHELEITYIDDLCISFKIFGIEGYNILRNPITVEISKEKIEIVCSQQLKYFLRKKFINPKIFCSCGSISEVTIRNINSHIHHNFVINDSEEIRYLDELQIGVVIKNHDEKNYLKTIFSSPQDFDINFNYYFRFGESGKELCGLFNIFDDSVSTRKYITYEFIDYENFGKKLNYFGASGKGKSITLIGALKYSVNHKKIGTLYINCKTLKVLLEKLHFSRVRQIFVDEILFLFYENYDKYLICLKKIKFFNLLNETSFWPLIDLILEECSNLDKKFIIGFDQYNDSIDPDNYLDNLEEKYLNANFKFIVISSMNETDVRQYKLNLLFEKNNSENIYELNSVCDNFKTDFNKDELIIFNKLGKTFKAYNEIQLIQDKNELKNYLNEKKKKYLFKIISFYKNGKQKLKFDKKLTEEEIMNISDNLYLNLLSFKISYKYSMSDMTKIIDFIPFKYFDINESYGHYTVLTSFPLINEILDDIFRYIIVNRSFNAFKQLSNNKGSAFSSLFEYKVRYNFYPPIKGEIDYFSNFIIHEAISMEVIIPKEKEKNEPKFIQKLELNKSYLVEQKQFGGKSLDFLIIHMSENPEVFGFQVSTYKPHIFPSLEKTYKILLERLKLSFKIDINEDNAYFGYIFDYSRIGDQLYQSMLTNCKKNGMKYSFFDADSNTLFDDKYIKTKNIYDIVGKPKMKKNNIKINYFYDSNIESFNPINKLNGGQISTIINV